jgi:predicted anti-sigma-YlaC factor YlaD
VSFLATDCARARESVSVQLDGELPEFDLDRLETHLRICPACAAWAAQVRDVTQQLREAPLEVPAEPFVLPRAGRRRAVSASVALASAAAVVATMFISAGQHQSSALLHQAVPLSGVAANTPKQMFTGHLLEDGKFIGISVNLAHLSLRPV